MAEFGASPAKPISNFICLMFSGITNLPFSTFGTTGSSYACGSVGYFTGLTVPASNIVTLLVQHAGANYILIVNTPVGGGDSSQTAMDTAVAEFFFSATYMTAT